MLKACRDQSLLKSLADQSVIFCRYRVFNYHQCVRCIPCQGRRPSFLAWDASFDTTAYVYVPPGNADSDHAWFDDVRSMAMALREVKSDGLRAWMGPALAYPKMGDTRPVLDLVQRGLDELSALHKLFGVR